MKSKEEIKQMHYADTRDLYITLAYIEKIIQVTGKTRTKILREADVNIYYYYNIKKHLEGYKWRAVRRRVNLSVIIRLASVHKVPFNTSDFEDILNK